jgi:hypothetical protein
VRTKLSARTHIDREPTLGVRATGKQQTHTRGRILAGLSQRQHKEKHDFRSGRGKFTWHRKLGAVTNNKTSNKTGDSRSSTEIER